MTTLVALSLVLFSITTGVIGMYEPVCNPEEYERMDGDPYIPELPDKFYYSLEASLVERDITVFASEYYDGIGNRGRFDFVGRGSKVTAISDFSLGEAFVFPNSRTGDECTASTLTTNTTSRSVRFLFGIVPGENNTVHIGAPSFIFTNRINSSNVEYYGITNTSRGIPAYQWQTCVSIPNNSFTLDYYFTNSSLWTTSYASDGYVPVTVVLKGRRVTNETTGETIDIEHYYTFVEYRSGDDAVSDDDFAVPLGLICSNRNPGKPLPPFPDFFSTAIEQIDNNNGVKTIVNYQEYYDTKYDLFRLDGYSTMFANGAFSLIEDLNAEVVHFIDPVYGNCTSSPFTSDFARFIANNGSNDLHLKSVKDLFYGQDSNQFVYEGTVNYDGVLSADVWIAQNLTNFTIANMTYHNSHYQIFFTRPGQVISAVTGVSSDPVIIELLYKSDLTTVYPNGSETTTSFSQLTSLFSFLPQEPPLDVFDVRVCYSQDQYVDVLMRLQLNRTHFNRNNIRQNVRQAITDYATSVGMPLLSPLQISSIGIRPFDGQYTGIHLHISNVSANATKKWPYSAKALVDRMLEGVSNGDRLPFTIIVDDEEYTPYYMIDDDDEPSECSTSSQLSNGAVAGIAIGVFIFGIVVGVIAILLAKAACSLLCGGSKGSADFSGAKRQEAAKYERQIDELPSPVDGDTD